MQLVNGFEFDVDADVEVDVGIDDDVVILRGLCTYSDERDRVLVSYSLQPNGTALFQLVGCYLLYPWLRNSGSAPVSVAAISIRIFDVRESDDSRLSKTSCSKMAEMRLRVRSVFNAPQRPLCLVRMSLRYFMWTSQANLVEEIIMTRCALSTCYT